MSVRAYRSRRLTARSFQSSGLNEFPRLPLNTPIEELVVSGNPIVSFKGLLSYPRLVSLKCENTRISSFTDGVCLRNLKYLALTNSPVSKYPYYRIMAGIVFGSQLERIDLTPVKKTEQSLIEYLIPVVRDYLIKGWILTLTQPVKLFHPQSKQIKVIYVKPMTTEPQNKPSCVFRVFDIVADSALAFRRGFQSVLYTDLHSWDKKRETIKGYLTERNPDICLAFVREILQAFNLRPMHFDTLCDILVSCYRSHMSHFLKTELLEAKFWSHGVMARVLDRLFHEHILRKDDLIPMFYSIYSVFDLSEGDFQLNNNVPLEPFSRVFGHFSELIETIDPVLYLSSLLELKNRKTEAVDVLVSPEWREKHSKVIEILTHDDCEAFTALSDSDVNACLSEFFNIQTQRPKQVAAALAGATECFDSVAEDSAFEDPSMELCAIVGGSPIIIGNLPKLNSELVVKYHQYLTQDGLTDQNASLLPVAVSVQNYREILSLVDNSVPIDPAVLRSAIVNGQSELVHLLILCGVYCDRAMELAIQSKDPGIVRTVLSSKFTDVNKVYGDRQWTALHIAAGLGEPVIVNVLLNAPGIDVSIKDICGKTARDVAAARKHKGVLEMMAQYSKYVGKCNKIV